MSIERDAQVLAQHWRRQSGMSYGSPDRCACGAETRPAQGDEDVSERRALAFAEHQATMLAKQQNAPEKFLCYIEGDGAREAAIVFSIAEIHRFIEEHWAGQPLSVHPDEWVEIIDDLNSPPQDWGDGIGMLQFDFENGYMSVRRLGS